MIMMGLNNRGDRTDASEQMYHLFEEALETAPGAHGFEGLDGYVNGAEASEAIKNNADSILTAAAIAFAGADIADAIRRGLSEIAEATASAAPGQWDE